MIFVIIVLEIVTIILIVIKKLSIGKEKNSGLPSPFCKLSNINISKYFLTLIDRHFNKDNPLNKIFNHNTLKMSYSFTNNISKIVYNHDKNLIDKSQRINILRCNCRNKEDYPMGGMCNSVKVVYQTNIFPMKNNKEKKVYIGFSA